MGKMGVSDGPVNRREALHEMKRQRQDDTAVVDASSPDEKGEIRTTDHDADEMLAQYTGKKEEKTMKKDKIKSQRYGDVPTYSLRELDTETLRDEVFPALDFSSAEKEAAAALIRNPTGSLAEVAPKCSTSKKTVGRVRRIIETQRDPTERQLEVLKYLRENPDASFSDISNDLDYSGTMVKLYARSFRHERVEIDVPDDAEMQGETTVDEEEDQSGTEEKDAESVVERDLNGDDEITHKYDTGKRKGSTEQDQSTTFTVKSRSDLEEVLTDLDERLTELEEQDIPTARVPNSTEERISALENRLKGVQSVTNRIENQQTNLERFVEEELETSEDLEELKDTVEDLEEQCQNMTETMDLEWDETTLGKRVERISESLASHKETLRELREREPADGVSSDFTTEEKRMIIVSLAENGQDELIDRVLDEI